MSLAYHILMLADLAALTPRQRFSSVGKHWQFSWLKGANLALIVFGLLAILVALGAVIHLVRYRRQIWALFHHQGTAIGLDPQQRQVLERIARAGKLKNPASVLMSPEAFDRAVASMRDKPEQSAVQALRDQLGLSVQLKVDLAAGNAPAGSMELVLVPADGEEMRGRLVSAAPDRTVVQLDQPAKVTLGQTWQVRYAAGGSVAQMLARVSSNEGQQVTLVPISRARVLERRRYRRVSDSRAARLGALPLLRPEAIEEGLYLNEGTVIDSGGPGVKVRMPKPSPAYSLGQRAFLLAQLREGCCLQAIGRVRRIEETKDASLISLELTDLEQEEKAQLMREVARNRPTEAAGLAAPQAPSPVNQATPQNTAAQGEQPAAGATAAQPAEASHEAAASQGEPAAQDAPIQQEATV